MLLFLPENARYTCNTLFFYSVFGEFVLIVVDVFFLALFSCVCGYQARWQMAARSKKNEFVFYQCALLLLFLFFFFFAFQCLDSISSSTPNCLPNKIGNLTSSRIISFANNNKYGVYMRLLNAQANNLQANKQ